MATKIHVEYKDTAAALLTGPTGTINFEAQNNYKIDNMSANMHLTLTNVSADRGAFIQVVQNAAGGFKLSIDASVSTIRGNGTTVGNVFTITIDEAAIAYTLIGLWCISSNVIWVKTMSNG